MKECVAFVIMNLEPLKMKAVDYFITTSDSITGHKTGILHFLLCFYNSGASQSVLPPRFPVCIFYSLFFPPFHPVTCLWLFSIFVGCSSSAARLELFPVPGLPQLWSWSCLSRHWNKLKQWLKKKGHSSKCLCGTSVLFSYYVQAFISQSVIKCCYWVFSVNIVQFLPDFVINFSVSLGI